ncbi:MAG: hypothetical protein JSS20_15440 [Proteobacteria bacterium]|nr:hypothetical protein [Pseudomonadota bacterium]
MTGRLSTLGACLVVFIVALASSAQAACTINGTGFSISPLTASTGTYTYPTAATSQAVSITMTGTTVVTGGSSCTIGITFQRASYPPATMANLSGGTMTLPYTITTAANGGGSTILFTGGTVNTANIAQLTFSPGNGTRAFSQTFTLYFLMQPNSPQQWGSYSDSLTAYGISITNLTVLGSAPFTVTGTVTKVCTIGGIYHPSADSATIPVSSGSVVTSVINKSYASAACNAPANLQLTSQSGGVKTTGTPPSGFTNIIDYSSSATFSGATATLNTASTPTATGPESGTAASTTGTLPSGTLSVAITPTANSQKLLSGTYSDTLTITITPQ